MEQVNQFIKGTETDLDPSKREPISWDVPTINCRITSHEGKGYDVIPLNSTKASFTLPTDYLPVGGCVFDEIIYLALVRPSDGSCQLGSYPSIDRSTKVFTDDYRPLPNWKDVNGNIGDFITTLLAFDTEHRVDMFAYPSYDDSVDLYLADFKNSNRIINVGFDGNGNLLNRYYDASSFDSETKLVKSTTLIPKLSLTSVDSGGTMLPGNYYFYIRLVSESFDRTPFLSQIGPISVGNGTTTLDSEGCTDEDSQVRVTNKMVLIKVDNLDQGYRYVEVGYCRYHGPSISYPISETKLIHKEFVINNNTLDIVISGEEELESLLISDIMAQNTMPDICKSHRICSGRYEGANWKDSFTYDRNVLKQFAQLFSPCSHLDIGNPLQDVTVNDYETNYNGSNQFLPQYKDPNNILNRLGYARGTIYPFGIKVLFDTGELSDVYPIQGLDDNDSTKTNTDGLLRFIDFNSKNAGEILSAVNDLKVILGVTISGRSNLITTFIAANSGLFNHVVGIYFVRGEEKKNTLYEGIGIPCVDRVGTKEYNQQTNTTTTYQYPFGESLIGGGATTGGLEVIPTDDESLYVPLLCSEMPTRWKSIGGDERYGSATIRYLQYVCSPPQINAIIPVPKTKIGLFSTDYLFEAHCPLYDDQGLFLNEVYEIPANSSQSYISGGLHTYPDSAEQVYPEKYLFEIDDELLKDFVNFKDRNSTRYPCVIKRTVGKTFREGNQFSTKMGELAHTPTSSDKEWGYAVDYSNSDYANRNRTFEIARYIGCDVSGKTLNYFSASYYRLQKYQDSDSYWNAILNGFYLQNEQYTEISGLISISELASNNYSFNLFGGNIFLQRTVFRQMRYAEIPSEYGQGVETKKQDDLSRSNITYRHGLLFSFISQNRLNTQMRCDVKGDKDTYTYFPKTCAINGHGNAFNWGIWHNSDMYKVESFYLNAGYNITDSIRLQNGYNPFLPFIRSKYPKRIYYSNKIIPGSYTNNARLFGIGQYKDFPQFDGDLTVLIEHLGSLISVTERGIYEHYFNEQRVSVPTSIGDLLLGNTDVLSEQVRPLADYGSQHQFGIIKGDTGIYGVDFARKIIWMMSIGTSGLTQVRGITDLGEATNNITLVRDTIDAVAGNDLLPDKSIIGQGVICGYNPEYKEVYFTFLNSIVYKNVLWGSCSLITTGPLAGYIQCVFPDNLGIPDNSHKYLRVNGVGCEFAYWNGGNGTTNLVCHISAQSPEIQTVLNGWIADGGEVFTLEAYGDTVLGKTLVFYEPMKNFTGHYTFTPSFYLSTSRRLFSTLYALSSLVGQIYEHDDKTSFLVIYGSQRDMILSFYVNGMVGDQNMTNEEKVFRAGQLVSSSNALDRIEFETEFQNAVLTPFQDPIKFWRTATYREGKWSFPFPLHQGNQSGQFKTESELRGRWIKVTLVYNQSIQTVIKSFRTIFKLSKV